MRTIEMRGNYVFNAYRQVWLASLGAAVVTRDWAQAEAVPMFRKFVKEGTLVESRTFRKVGDRLEGSITLANDFWRTARGTMTSTVKQAADTATTLVRETLPARLPKIALPAMFRGAKPAKRRAVRATRTVKARTARTTAKARKTAKRATKRS